MLIAAIVYIVSKVVVRSSAMVLKWDGSPKSFKGRHFLLIWHRQSWSYDLIPFWRHHLHIHRLKSGRLPFRCTISLDLAPGARSHGELCLQLLCLCSNRHLLGDLVYYKLPLLPDAWVTMLGGQVLVDHLDYPPVLLHRQSVVAEDCILSCHFQFVEERRLHLA